MTKRNETRSDYLLGTTFALSIGLFVLAIFWTNFSTFDERPQLDLPSGGGFFLLITDPPEAKIVLVNETGTADHVLGLSNRQRLSAHDFPRPEDFVSQKWPLEVRFEKDGFTTEVAQFTSDQVRSGVWPSEGDMPVKLRPTRISSYLDYLWTVRRPWAYLMLGGLLGGVVFGTLFLRRIRYRAVEQRHATSSSQETFLGSTFQGHLVVDELDEGGSGKVYRVLDSRTLDENRPRALKIIKYSKYESNLAHLKASRERFDREMALLRTMEHPNIYKIVDFGREESYDWVIMPMYSKSLKQVIAEGGLTREQILSYAKQIALGLTEAHDRNVTHRDLKPGNIMLEGENLVIIDFGMAKMHDAQTLTHQGAVPGTPMYMASEQLHGVISPKVDQFAYGLILFEMLTGKLPYRVHEDVIVIFSDRLTKSPMKLTELDPNQSKELELVLGKMTDPDPNERYFTVLEAYRAFEAAF